MGGVFSGFYDVLIYLKVSKRHPLEDPGRVGDLRRFEGGLVLRSKLLSESSSIGGLVGGGPLFPSPHSV